ncbi:MAG: SUMF1/EgtB/PvdO family nonheme iron enzyme [Acidobacteriota bacterium]
MSPSWPPNASSDVGAPRLFPPTVWIPGGSLEITEPGGAGHARKIEPFLIGRTPVINREYAPFLAACRVSEPPWWNDPRFCAPMQPVVGVTWTDAAAFCDWLSEADVLPWRLPTELEWEFAASGGRIAPRTAWGDAIPPREIPEGALEAPWEAGRGQPNGYGVMDAGTIVHEWCANWSAGDPPASGLRRRASRGGSWRHAIRWSAPSAASSLPPEYRYSDYGFRVLRELGARPSP